MPTSVGRLWEENMKTENVRLSGLNGTWYLFETYCTPYGTYYLWESELYGEYYGAVLTDETLTVIDYECESDIRIALSDNGII
jgi:hypothetical protein